MRGIEREREGGETHSCACRVTSAAQLNACLSGEGKNL